MRALGQVDGTKADGLHRLILVTGINNTSHWDSNGQRQAGRGLNSLNIADMLYQRAPHALSRSFLTLQEAPSLLCVSACCGVTTWVSVEYYMFHWGEATICLTIRVKQNIQSDSDTVRYT